MNWFFKQWVFKADFPKIEFSHSKAIKEGEKYKVECRFAISEVPDGFTIIMPIKLEFENDKVARLRYPIKAPLAEFELPALPMQPKKIEINEFESTLAEIKRVKWKE